MNFIGSFVYSIVCFNFNVVLFQRLSSINHSFHSILCNTIFMSITQLAVLYQWNGYWILFGSNQLVHDTFRYEYERRKKAHRRRWAFGSIIQCGRPKNTALLYCTILWIMWELISSNDVKRSDFKFIKMELCMAWMAPVVQQVNYHIIKTNFKNKFQWR